MDNLTLNCAIEVKGLVSGYGRGKIIDSITFTLERGLIHAVIGTSGCGKTTLLKNMLGLMKYREGSVKVLDTEMNNQDEVIKNGIRERTGVLFQRGALLNSMTIEDNVALPLILRGEKQKDNIHEKARSILQKVGLRYSEKKYPTELSGGMVKRAALARALIGEPEILFCDEPSAGLDPVTTKGIDELLLSLRAESKMTVVIITHDLDSIFRIADRVLFLHDRKLIVNAPLSEAAESTLPPVSAFFKRTVSC